jgi:ketol-acid reductoisomerase
MYRGGLNYMRHSVSDTAEYGDYVAGDRIVTADTKKAMQKLLDEIKDGSFARRWIDENKTGRPTFATRREKESDHQIESVGRAMRRMMPFLDAKEVLPGQRGVAAPATATSASEALAGAAP